MARRFVVCWSAGILACRFEVKHACSRLWALVAGRMPALPGYGVPKRERYSGELMNALTI